MQPNRNGSTTCALIRVLAKTTANDHSEKIRIIKSLLSNNHSQKSVSEELKVLLSDKSMDGINFEVALIWELQASITQKLSQLASIANEEQKTVVSEVFNFTDLLKKSAAKTASLLEEERKKLIVVQEVFRKNASRKAFNKSFQNKSFKLALEELCDSASEIQTQKKTKNRKQSFEDDEEDNTKYFSLAEYHEEIEKAKNSFILPHDSSVVSYRKRSLPATLLPKTSLSHSFISKLISGNSTFQKFPVLDSQPVRNRLPILRNPNVKFDVWGLFKDNIGKDFSKITLPVYLNEPMSGVQRGASFLEYAELLRRANRCEDPSLRLALVSMCANMQNYNLSIRLKKPFNSLLGETFEFIDGDLKYLGEQVSHHPPITAYYCECDDFIFAGDSMMKTNISIGSVLIHQVGSFSVTLKRTSETFVRNKLPTASLHNILVGKMYLWITGEGSMLNSRTQDVITMEYKKKGWSSKNDYQVEGAVTNARGEIKYHLLGKWDSYFSVMNPKTQQETQLCKRFDFPQDSDLQYNFSKFAINLNHLSTEMLSKIAPTDSRLRPDQRAYENGDLELAALEKNRLEENQRKRRKVLESQNKQWKPMWFDFETNGKTWKTAFKGEYFKAREKGCWPSDILDLFND